MSVTVVESNAEFVTLQLVVRLQKTFLETEETLQSALNEAGTQPRAEKHSNSLIVMVHQLRVVESVGQVKDNCQKPIKPLMEW